jgi:hypothetical protein
MFIGEGLGAEARTGSRSSAAVASLDRLVGGLGTTK